MSDSPSSSAKGASSSFGDGLLTLLGQSVSSLTKGVSVPFQALKRGVRSALDDSSLAASPDLRVLNAVLRDSAQVELNRHAWDAAHDTSLLMLNTSGAKQTQPEDEHVELSVTDEERSRESDPALEAAAASPPATLTRRLRATPIRASGDEYLAYVLTARCILTPLLRDSKMLEPLSNESDWLHKVTFGISDAVLPSSSHVTVYGLNLLLEELSVRAKQLNTGKLSDQLLLRSIRAFLSRSRLEGKQLVENRKNSPEDFVNMFKQGMLIECSREGVDKDDARATSTLGEFRRILDTVLKKHSTSGRAVQASGSAATPSNQMLTAIDSQDETEAMSQSLKLVFHLSDEEHSKVMETEERVQTKQIVRMELREQLRRLDDSPVYNKETFVQKTGAAMKWRKAEEERLTALLKQVVEPGEDSSDASDDETESDEEEEEEAEEEEGGGVVPPPDSAATTTTSARDDTKVVSSGAASLGVPGGKPSIRKQFVIKVVRARGLMAKSKGTANPYVVAEFDNSAMRTTTVGKTINPAWDELCRFYVRTDDTSDTLSFKVTVWEEDSSSAIRNILNPFNSNHPFLGQVEASVSRAELARWPVEHEYKLEKRSAKSHISGSIRLRFTLEDEPASPMPPDKSKLQHLKVPLSKLFSSPRSERGEHKSKSASSKTGHRRPRHRSRAPATRVHSTLTYDHHYLLSVLIAHIVDEELARYNAIAYRQHTVFCLSRPNLRLINEFCARYGVSRIFAAIVVFEKIVHSFVRRDVDILALSYVFEDLRSAALESTSHFTRDHQARLAAVLPELETTFVDIISNYKDHFPFSTPPGHLRQTLRALSVLYDEPFLRVGDLVTPRNIHTVVTQCVRNNCTLLYQRLRAWCAPIAKPRSEGARIYSVTKELAQAVLHEIDTTAMHFAPDFQFFTRSSNVKLNVVAESVKAFSSLLGADIGGAIERETEKNGFFKESLELYTLFRRYNTRCSVLMGETSAGDATEWFPVTQVMRGQIMAWLGIAKTRANEWLSRAVEADTMESLSETSKHSSSVVDLFCLFNEVYEFVDALQWPNDWQLRGFHVQVALLAATILPAYSRLLAEKLVSSARAMHDEQERSGVFVRFFKKGVPAEDRMRLAKGACVAVNNLVFAREHIGSLAKKLLGRTLTTIEGTQVMTALEVAERLQAAPFQLSTAEGTAHEIEALLQSCLIEVNRVLSTLLTNLLSWSGPLFDKMIGDLVADEPSLLKRIFVRRRVADTNTPIASRLLNDAVQAIEPVHHDCDDYMSAIAPFLYVEGYTLCLEKLWDLCLGHFEKALMEQGFQSTRPLDMLSEALMLVWDLFRGSNGDGLPLEMLSTTRYHLLVQLLTIVRNKQLGVLVSMHDIYVGNTQAQELIRNVALLSDDKAVRSFAKRRRSNTINLSITAPSATAAEAAQAALAIANAGAAGDPRLSVTSSCSTVIPPVSLKVTPSSPYASRATAVALATSSSSSASSAGAAARAAAAEPPAIVVSSGPTIPVVKKGRHKRNESM